MTPPTQPPAPSPEQEKITNIPRHLDDTPKTDAQERHEYWRNGIRYFGVNIEFTRQLERKFNSLTADFAKERAELASRHDRLLDQLADIRSATTLHEEGDEETSIPEYIHSLRTTITATERNLLNATNLLAHKEDTIRSLEEKLETSEIRYTAFKTHTETTVKELEEKVREAEKIDRHRRSTLGGLNQQNLALAAALKQAREMIERVQGHLIRGYYRSPSETVDDLTAVLAALSAHPDSALMGNELSGYVLRLRADKDGHTLLKNGLAIAGGSKRHCVEMLTTQLLADLGGQQPLSEKTDKELADELDAKDRLKRHGYKQVVCPACQGLGIYPLTLRCIVCNGRGFTWEAPVT